MRNSTDNNSDHHVTTHAVFLSWWNEHFWYFSCALPLFFTVTSWQWDDHWLCSPVSPPQCCSRCREQRVWGPACIDRAARSTAEGHGGQLSGPFGNTEETCGERSLPTVPKSTNRGGTRLPGQQAKGQGRKWKWPPFSSFLSLKYLCMQTTEWSSTKIKLTKGENLINFHMMYKQMIPLWGIQQGCFWNINLHPAGVVFFFKWVIFGAQLRQTPCFPAFYECGISLGQTPWESWFSPLVSHCVHGHCVFLCTCPFYDDPQNTKRTGLNRKNSIYMPTRKCVLTHFCLFLFFSYDVFFWGGGKEEFPVLSRRC